MSFVDWFSLVQAWIFETIVDPFIYYAGLGEFTEVAFEGVEWFLIGVCELVILYLILRPLEALIPVHTIENKYARWNDFIYTALHRLGIFSLLIFSGLTPALDSLTALVHMQGMNPFNLERLWPGMVDHPVMVFFVYVVVLDFCDYWYHRAQHQFDWWWALHSVHHSQRDMNLWSDNRNHLLDDILHDIFMGLIALVIGVQPSQYALLVVMTRMIQSLQHANVRLHFGKWGEYFLVSPRYHRTHHAIGVGHESAGSGTLGGHNFAVLMPIWDVLFGTVMFTNTFYPTGIRDQLPPPQGEARDYGSGFWSQQYLGLCRLFSRRTSAQDRPLTNGDR